MLVLFLQSNKSSPLLGPHTDLHANRKRITHKAQTKQGQESGDLDPDVRGGRFGERELLVRGVLEAHRRPGTEDREEELDEEGYVEDEREPESLSAGHGGTGGEMVWVSFVGEAFLEGGPTFLLVIVIGNN